MEALNTELGIYCSLSRITDSYFAQESDLYRKPNNIKEERRHVKDNF